jgi:hypothetical protein
VLEIGNSLFLWLRNRVTWFAMAFGLVDMIGEKRRLWWNAAIRFAVALGCASVVLKCHANDWNRDQTCQLVCSEPTCRAADSCTLDSDCPVATVCASGECRPPKSIMAASTALVQGFQTNELELTRTQPGSFSVEAPKAAVTLNCGVFVGLPEFDMQHSPGQDPTGALKNANACVARYRVFPLDASRSSATNFSLRLDDLEPLPELTSCSTGSALNSGVRGVVAAESLRLGCWAMSLNQVVAASELLDLDPSELPGYGSVPLSSCAQASTPTDGSNCWLSPQIGICRDQVCQVRDGGVADVAPPTADAGCAAAVNDAACQLGSPGLGRCYAGNCLDQNILPPLVGASCVGEALDWTNCFPSPLGIIGSCFNQLCRQRCHDSADCTTDEVCTYPDSPSYLGACKGKLEAVP